MTPARKAARHITDQLTHDLVRAHRVELFDEVHARIKEGLVALERKVFREVLAEKGIRPPHPKEYSLKDIVVYKGGAFGIVLAAPGGAVEVGEDGKPTPLELERIRVAAFLEEAGP